MRHYETIFIIDPELPEDECSAVVEKFKGILEKDGSEMVKVDLWGRRRLAYQVKKYTKGFFVLFEYGAKPAVVDELERNFKIDERVIRFLSVKLGDVFDQEAIAQAQAEAAAKASRRSAESSDDDDFDSRFSEEDTEEDSEE